MASAENLRKNVMLTESMNNVKPLFIRKIQKIYKNMFHIK